MYEFCFVAITPSKWLFYVVHSVGIEKCLEMHSFVLQ